MGSSIGTVAAVVTVAFGFFLQLLSMMGEHIFPDRMFEWAGLLVVIFFISGCCFYVLYHGAKVEEWRQEAVNDKADDENDMDEEAHDAKEHMVMCRTVFIVSVAGLFTAGAVTLITGLIYMYSQRGLSSAVESTMWLSFILCLIFGGSTVLFWDRIVKEKRSYVSKKQNQIGVRQSRDYNEAVQNSERLSQDLSDESGDKN